jgi:octaprenyl-diphosphate synthase
MSTALKNIPQLVAEPVREHLEVFNKDFFRRQMKTDVALLDLVVRYMHRTRGKQVRPMLVFLCAGLTGEITNRTYVGAAMMELLHTATLVHDDVVDNAAERRGLASINAVWKNKVAVEHGEGGFLGVTSRTVQRMSEGELLQIQKSRQKTLDEATYFSIISDKTASLLSACCEIGAMSASADPQVHARLRQFGELLGLAFQIRDDVLDYTGKTAILGKPVGNDIKEGKITLPLLIALRSAEKTQAKHITALVKRKGASDKEVRIVQDFVNAHRGIAEAQAKAVDLSNQALSILDTCAPSVYKDALRTFAAYVVERER